MLSIAWQTWNEFDECHLLLPRWEVEASTRKLGWVTASWRQIPESTKRITWEINNGGSKNISFSVKYPNSLYPSDYEVSEYSLAWISPVFCSLPVLSLSPRPFPQRPSSRPLLTMALRPLSFKDSKSSWKISCEWWLFTLRPINKKKKLNPWRGRVSRNKHLWKTWYSCVLTQHVPQYA